MIKTPWHIWVVGVLSLLWNAGGAFDFMMSATNNQAYLDQMTAEQLAFFAGFPLWAKISWGIAVWSAVFGSILILLRYGIAVWAFGIGLVTMAMTSVHNYILSDVKITEIAGTGAMLFTLAIIVVAVLLLIYAKRQKANGVLR